MWVKGIFRHKFNPWSNILWHRVKPPLERSSFPTASLCSFSNLRKDRTITIHCSLCLQQETAIKKPLIATNNEQHQTSATVQIGSQHIVRGIKHLLALPDFYWKDNTTHHSPAAACSLWGSLESITECSRVPQLKDENVWLLLRGNAIRVHMCIAYQFITVITESWQGKEQNWAFLTALGNRLVRASPQQASCCRRVVSCVDFSMEIQQS